MNLPVVNPLSKSLRPLLVVLALALGLVPAFLGAAPSPGASAAAEAPAVDPKIDLLNAREPMEGLLTGGQITREQMEEAAAAGYGTIINLRGPGEPGSWDEAPFAEQLGMSYVAIPITGAGDLNEENARRLAKALDEAKDAPTILHCGSGNRVGALLALKAYHVDGKSADEALKIGLEGGMTRLQGTVEEYLATHQP